VHAIWFSKKPRFGTDCKNVNFDSAALCIYIYIYTYIRGNDSRAITTSRSCNGPCNNIQIYFYEISKDRGVCVYIFIYIYIGESISSNDTNALDAYVYI